MKHLALTLVLTLLSGVMPHAFSQQGPNKESSETVARPRTKKDGAPAGEPAEKEKIPSKYKRVEGAPSIDAPSFRSDVTAITLDVSVLDNKGNFIPGLPRGNFRV